MTSSLVKLVAIIVAIVAAIVGIFVVPSSAGKDNKAPLGRYVKGPYPLVISPAHIAHNIEQVTPIDRMNKIEQVTPTFPFKSPMNATMVP